MEINFGAYAVLDGHKHEFKKDNSLFWIIRPPTFADDLAIAKYISSGNMVTAEDGTRRAAPPTNMNVQHYEVALLFGGTNLTDDVKPGDDLEQVKKLVSALPREMVDEVWEKIADVCPGWGPILPKAS